ncbi:hypothetical protein [Pseudomonas fluorescens]|uniref:hypothetical protein n=1 Tax=Pseudomonas fluorescens TaxID=294 RepID=UPI0017828DE3|nr:hypothetical protein [Pseudomonas fluorescens]
MTGDFGLYANGNVSSALTASKKTRDGSTMADLIAQNSAKRTTVDKSMDTP